MEKGTLFTDSASGGNDQTLSASVERDGGRTGRRNMILEVLQWAWAPLFAVVAWAWKAIGGLNTRMAVVETNTAKLEKMCDDTSRVRACSSTRIGKRPCSSGNRSEGFET